MLKIKNFITNFYEEIKKDYIFYLLLIIYMSLILVVSNFRDMINDESLYFHETFLLSELIKSGAWVGNYGVGLHGFLFKIPPAIIFLITGPSVTVVTIYHVILTGIVAILSYKLSSCLLKNKLYGILSTAVLLGNFHFLLSSVTYLREIPMILIILLLLYCIVKNKKPICISLFFLLLLDVKEYAFFIFALVYLVWLFIDSNKVKFINRVWSIIKKAFIVFLPSLIWIILMFTTDLIPVNMFLASIIGLKDNSFGYLINHFELDISTVNSLEGSRNIPLILIKETWAPFIQFLCSFINIILSYIGKVLYSRVFSFLSVPKVVILPVVITSVMILKRYIINRKEKIKNFAFLSLTLLIWLMVYILRASHGRYLLPILPIIAVIYLYILFYQRFSNKQKIFIIISTFLYITAGLLFETVYIVPKAILEYSLFILFSITLFKPQWKQIKYVLVVLLSVFSLSTALLFSYVQGQIHGYVNFGENRNAQVLANLVPTKDRYWINSEINSSLISTLNKERYLDPEWRWQLHDIVKWRRDTLEAFGTQQSYTFPVIDMDLFKKNIFTYRIKEVFLIETEVDKESYPNQEYLNSFISSNWLEFVKSEEYKGMKVYIFTVIE